jgi:hypothetical protein
VPPEGRLERGSIFQEAVVHRRFLIAAAALVSVGTIGSAAHAHQGFFRWLGFGWGDGYHAQPGTPLSNRALHCPVGCTGCVAHAGFAYHDPVGYSPLAPAMNADGRVLPPWIEPGPSPALRYQRLPEIEQLDAASDGLD